MCVQNTGTISGLGSVAGPTPILSRRTFVIVTEHDGVFYARNRKRLRINNGVTVIIVGRARARVYNCAKDGRFAGTRMRRASQRRNSSPRRRWRAIII